MDHHTAIRRLRSPRLLRTALTYAIFDRTRSDYFYDPLEIEHALHNQDDLISEIGEELQVPEEYQPRTAFAHFPPKNELCDRRMVYIPIKDLTVRYGIAILFADEIESEIHPQCFAFRRAEGHDATIRFTQDFSTQAWAGFCAWQREQGESNSVLLRTDISSFYDSVSHDYLVEAVCRHLAIPSECALIHLFRGLLRIPVIYYSPSNDHVEGPAEMRQGLPIGDGVEGFLANIFLKDVDDAMAAADATYGRYVDDIRLFGRSREEVLHRLRILQEQLLRKGLNLNASKTEIAENRNELLVLISHNYGLAEYGDDEPPRAGMQVASHIDDPFAAFSRVFSEHDGLVRCSDAKDFCKYMSASDGQGNPLVSIESRQVWHVDRLREVVVNWRGPSKHAGWLLVQTATYRGVPQSTKQRALDVVLGLLEDGRGGAYARYRILHHLLKVRKSRNGGTFRLLDLLTRMSRRRIVDLVPHLIKAPAFELNLIGLYLARVNGAGTAELKRIARIHASRACEPIRNAIAGLTEAPADSTIVGPTHDEPDEISDPY